jgi:hypothetical protein
VSSRGSGPLLDLLDRPAIPVGIAEEGEPAPRELLSLAADNPNHRRARLVGLTDEGRRVLGAIQAAQRPWADAIGKAVGAPDLRSATDILDRLLGVMAARRGRDT